MTRAAYCLRNILVYLSSEGFEAKYLGGFV